MLHIDVVIFAEAGADFILNGFLKGRVKRDVR